MTAKRGWRHHNETSPVIHLNTVRPVDTFLARGKAVADNKEGLDLTLYQIKSFVSWDQIINRCVIG